MAMVILQPTWQATETQWLLELSSSEVHPITLSELN